MNLKTFIVRECANWNSGECLGIGAFNHRFRKPGECWAINGEKCGYFEQNVIPVIHRDDPADRKGLRRLQRQAVNEYFTQTKGKNEKKK